MAYSVATFAAKRSSSVSRDEIHSLSRPMVFSYAALTTFSIVKLTPITPSIMWYPVSNGYFPRVAWHIES
jgi:hypothetical protein